MAGTCIEADEVRVVGLDVGVSAPYGDSATVMHGSIVDEAFGDSARIVPDTAASPGVQRVGVVAGAYEHHAVHNGRRVLQAGRLANVEDPLSAELRDVGG